MADHTTGQVPKDHTILRSISALIASLPASENKGFREEFDTVSLALFYSPFELVSVIMPRLGCSLNHFDTAR